jgi:hypothetical protein
MASFTAGEDRGGMPPTLSLQLLTVSSLWPKHVQWQQVVLVVNTWPVLRIVQVAIKC